MQTFKVNRQFTVLGPCPGCVNWTLEYAEDVEQQWSAVNLWRPGDDPMIPVVALADRSEWHAVVEAILRDHLDECPGLREIMFDTV